MKMPLLQIPEYKEIYYQKLWKELLLIKKYPELIIGEKSLTLVKIYTDGFKKGTNMILQNKNSYCFYPGFESWLQKQTGIDKRRPWHKYILLFSANEEKAFERFYDKLDEYMRENYDCLEETNYENR